MGFPEYTVVTYEPDNSLKKGYVSIFSEIFFDLWKNRWLTFQLFKRDFLSAYKQSVIGILWSFIIPLFSVGTFVLLNRSGIFNIGSMNVPYPIYGLLGVAIWQLFSTGLVASSSALVRAGSMIVKINFSKKSLVIASVGQSIVTFLVQFILVCSLFLYYRFLPSMDIFLIPLLLFPILLLSLGLGFLLSLLNAVVRDIGNALSILMTFLLFITPVLYSKPESGLLSDISAYNPLYYLVSIPRDFILTGVLSEIKGYLAVSLFSALLFVVTLVIFHLTETRIAERI